MRLKARVGSGSGGNNGLVVGQRDDEQGGGGADDNGNVVLRSAYLIDMCSVLTASVTADIDAMSVGANVAEQVGALVAAQVASHVDRHQQWLMSSEAKYAAVATRLALLARSRRKLLNVEYPPLDERKLRHWTALRAAAPQMTAAALWQGIVERADEMYVTAEEMLKISERVMRALAQKVGLVGVARTLKLQLKDPVRAHEKAMEADHLLMVSEGDDEGEGVGSDELAPEAASTMAATSMAMAKSASEAMAATMPAVATTEGAATPAVACASNAKRRAAAGGEVSKARAEEYLTDLIRGTVNCEDGASMLRFLSQCGAGFTMNVDGSLARARWVLSQH